MLRVCSFLAFVLAVYAANGIDMSMAACPDYGQSTWNCMHNSYGDSFAIIEGFDGGYGINTHIKDCTNYAWNAGFSYVDIYGFFCPNCAGNNPCSTAVNNLLDYLSDNNVKFGTLWFDVEQCSGCWYSDLNSNFEYVQDCVNAAVARGQAVGIYSSHYEWGQTVGSATGLQKYPLWYASYNGEESFSDFTPFGGWTSPAMKQYNDHGDSSCSVSVDVNWYP